jgi:hypothetical protein
MGVTVVVRRNDGLPLVALSSLIFAAGLALWVRANSRSPAAAR